MGRQAPGRVRDAITDFLRSREMPATVQEICSAVRFELGPSVSASSVRSYLRLNIDRTFERASRGTYTLQLDEEQAPYEGGEQSSVYGTASLVQDDCFKWLKSQPIRSIHGVVTDPPYGIVEYTPEEQKKLRKG